MGQNFGTEQKALLDAVGGKEINDSDYMETFTLVRATTGSANHKWQSNPARALELIRRKKFAEVDEILDWADWYARETTLHENEAMTPNIAYRGAIAQGIRVMAGVAFERGRLALSNDLLNRCRSDIMWIILGAGPGPAKEVRNHHLDQLGVPFLYVGDGKKVSPVQGLPYFTQAGIRGHVRGGGHANHTGPIEDTLGEGISVLVSQATGLGTPRRKDMGDLDRAIKKRWPNLPSLGFSERDRVLARSYISNPTDELVAREILKIAAACLPDIPLTIIQYDDAAKAFFVHDTLHGSTTGTRQADVIYGDGTHYIASADTALRESKNSGGRNVQVQVCKETATQLICSWKSGTGKIIAAPKPTSNELWRINVNVGGRGAILIPKNGAAPPMSPTDPQPQRSLKVEALLLTDEECAALSASTGEPIRPGAYKIVASFPNVRYVKIHNEPDHGEPWRAVVTP